MVGTTLLMIMLSICVNQIYFMSGATLNNLPELIRSLNTEKQLIDIVTSYVLINENNRTQIDYPLIESIYLSIMEQYEELVQFSSLRYVLNMIIKQNQNNKHNVLKIQFWNQFFKVLFESTNIIKSDTYFCQYFSKMQDLNVCPDIDTFNIIINGLNTNKQIINPELAIHTVYHNIMIDHQVYPNMQTWEGIMKSFTHNNNVKEAINLWQEKIVKIWNRFGLFPSKKLFVEYLNIISIDTNGDWNYFIELMNQYHALYNHDSNYFRIYKHAFKHYDKSQLIPLFVDHFQCVFITKDVQLFADGQRFCMLAMLINKTVDKYYERMKIMDQIVFSFNNTQLIQNQIELKKLMQIYKNITIHQDALKVLINEAFDDDVKYPNMKCYESLMKSWNLNKNVDAAKQFWLTINFIPSQTLYYQYLMVLTNDITQNIQYFLQSIQRYIDIYDIEFIKIFEQIFTDKIVSPKLVESFYYSLHKYLMKTTSNPNTNYNIFTQWIQILKTCNKCMLLIPSFIEQYYQIFLTTNNIKLFAEGQQLLQLGIIIKSIKLSQNVDQYIEWISIATNRVKKEFNYFPLRKNALGLEILVHIYLNSTGRKFPHNDLIEFKPIAGDKHQCVFDLTMFDGITDKLQMVWIITQKFKQNRKNMLNQIVVFLCNDNVKNYLIGNIFNQLEYYELLYDTNYNHWKFVFPSKCVVKKLVSVAGRKHLNLDTAFKLILNYNNSMYSHRFWF